MVLFTLARFSRWDDAAEAARRRPPDLRYTRGVWHYVRGLAFAAKGDLTAATVERDSVVAIASAIPAEDDREPELGARAAPGRESTI